MVPWGDEGRSRWPQGESLPVVNQSPANFAATPRKKKKQDTKLNVPVVPVVLIWSCRAVYSPGYAGVAIISLDCFLISTVQPPNSQHTWMLRRVRGNTEEIRLNFCWFVTTGTTQKYMLHIHPNSLHIAITASTFCHSTEQKCNCNKQSVFYYCTNKTGITAARNGF